MVAAAACSCSMTEHSRVPAPHEHAVQRRLGKLALLAGDGIPDDEAIVVPGARMVEEDAAVARVDGTPAAAADGIGQAEGRCGDEAGAGGVEAVAEEA